MKYPTGVRIGMYGTGEICIFSHERKSGVCLYEAGDDNPSLDVYICEVELTQEEVEKVLTVIKDILQEMLNGKH